MDDGAPPTSRGLTAIADCFDRLGQRGETAFIPYVTAGDPDIEATTRFVRALVRGGADIVELGLPFSDPLADGPTIQAAVQRSLRGGFQVDDLFAAVREVRRDTAVPISIMTYYNPVLQRGLGSFVREASAAGVDGLIVPDLPLEEQEPLAAACGETGLALTPFVAPTTPQARRQRILDRALGFVYCVSLTGVTGARKQLPDSVLAFLAQVSEQAGGPIAVGFGVSGPAAAARLAPHTDGIVVGSAVVDRIAQADSQAAAAEAVEAFAADIKRVLT